ncbi:MAG: hypothetical protein ACLBM3_14625 [Dolichospermum sp.]|jgi:hypothetical protein
MNNPKQPQEYDVQRFQFNDKHDVEVFDAMLETYHKTETGYSLSYIPLPKAYEVISNQCNDTRIFPALVDIKLNFVILSCDSFGACCLWNELLSSNSVSSRNIVIENKFIAQFKLHRLLSSYVLRYRAIWDKIMRLIILLFCPEHYQRYDNTKKSRKGIFKKIAEESGKISSEFANDIHELLERFDNSFRTPEAHGTGTIKKWSFIEPMVDNPSFELMGYWNRLLDIMTKFNEILNDMNNDTFFETPFEVRWRGQ